MRIRIFQRGKISGSRTVDHQIFSTYTFTKCQIFVLRKNSGESISYPFAFGIEGLSNLKLYDITIRLGYEKVRRSSETTFGRGSHRPGPPLAQCCLQQAFLLHRDAESFCSGSDGQRSFSPLEIRPTHECHQ